MWQKKNLENCREKKRTIPNVMKNIHESPFNIQQYLYLISDKIN